MVWRVFSAHEDGPLVEIDGNMNIAMYKDILEKNLLTYAKETMPRRIGYFSRIMTQNTHQNC